MYDSIDTDLENFAVSYEWGNKKSKINHLIIHEWSEMFCQISGSNRFTSSNCTPLQLRYWYEI